MNVVSGAEEVKSDKEMRGGRRRRRPRGGGRRSERGARRAEGRRMDGLWVSAPQLGGVSKKRPNKGLGEMILSDSKYARGSVNDL